MSLKVQLLLYKRSLIELNIRCNSIRMISGFLTWHRKTDTSLVNFQQKASLLYELALYIKYLNVQLITFLQEMQK